MSDIFVYQGKLPHGIDEMVAPCPDDGYTIYIDERLSDERKMKAYQHALNHINNNDWAKNDVQEIEAAAHGIPVPEKPGIFAELIKRHQKSRAARKKKLDRIARKYAGMTPAEIDIHNEEMIARRDAAL